MRAKGTWRSRTESGFTLVEIAIVLVIIGLLLGGILKGQELINSAKVKNLANDFRVIPTYIYAYQDKYRSLPGDDSAAVAHLGTTNTTPTAGNGNGVIEGAWDAAGTEAAAFWNHIRKAGLMSGTEAIGSFLDDDPYTPKNAVGGRIGVSGNGVTGGPASPLISGMSGSYQICSRGIPGKFAKQLDIQMDDGDTATGNMRTVPATTTASQTPAPAMTTIQDDTTYIVCMTI
jgi:prepilin-type N-terminal cleavage/methylation domain-containing protein